MGSETRKALNFDLNTLLITDNMSGMQIQGFYNKAYYDIRKYLTSNGFEHTQESGYTSKEPIGYAKVQTLVENLTEEIPYLKDAIKSMQVTSVERTYDVTEMLHNEHSVKVLKPKNLFKLKTTYGIEIDDTIEEQKSIRFDLSGELLEQKFKEENITYDTTIAYDWLRKHFEGLGYTHEQGSVYKTPENKKDSEVIRDLIQFSTELPYVAEAFSSVQITNVGRVYDLTEVANGKIVTTSEKEVYEQMEMKIDKDNNLSF